MGGGFAHGGFHGAVLLLGRERRHDADDEGGCGVFEDAGGVAVTVALDLAAGRVLRVAVDAREFERQRVGQGHVAVDAPEEGGMIAGDAVNELMVGQRGGIPVLMVPDAVVNPRAGGKGFGEVGDALPELSLALCIAGLHGNERFAATEEVHVGIVESGEKQAAAQVDDTGGRSGQLANFGVGADGEDGVAVESHGLRDGLRGVFSPDLAVDQDKRCLAGPDLRAGGQGECQQEQQYAETRWDFHVWHAGVCTSVHGGSGSVTVGRRSALERGAGLRVGLFF